MSPVTDNEMVPIFKVRRRFTDFLQQKSRIRSLKALRKVDTVSDLQKQTLAID